MQQEPRELSIKSWHNEDFNDFEEYCMHFPSWEAPCSLIFLMAALPWH